MDSGEDLPAPGRGQHRTPFNLQLVALVPPLRAPTGVDIRPGRHSRNLAGQSGASVGHHARRFPRNKLEVRYIFGVGRCPARQEWWRWIVGATIADTGCPVAAPILAAGPCPGGDQGHVARASARAVEAGRAAGREDERIQLEAAVPTGISAGPRSGGHQSPSWRRGSPCRADRSCSSSRVGAHHAGDVEVEYQRRRPD